MDELPAHDPHCCCAASAARIPAAPALLSYLLFAPGFCKALIALGRADAHTKRAEIDALMRRPDQALATSTRQS